MTFEVQIPLHIFNPLDILNLEDEERNETLHQFVTALQETGIVALHTPQIREQVQNLYLSSEQYFNQTSTCKFSDQNTSFGYSRYQNYEQYKALVNCKDLPASNPFNYYMTSGASKLCSIADHVFALLHMHFGFKPENAYSDRALSFLTITLAHPPPNPKPTIHHDRSALTLITPLHSAVFEIFTLNRWVPVDIPEDHTLLIIGKQFESRTAGILTSQAYRFTANHMEQATYATFQASWPLHTSLAPKENLLQYATKEMTQEEAYEYQKRFSDQTVKEWLS